MARTRNIKPGFFKNDLLAEIEPLGRLLFAGLWTIADREGRLEDRPKRIKAEVLPYDNCDINALLTILFDKEFITRYEISAQRYIQITNFNKHQNPHVNEPASEIPAPEEYGTSTIQVPEKYGTSTGAAQFKSCLVPSTNHLKPSTNHLDHICSSTDADERVVNTNKHLNESKPTNIDVKMDESLVVKKATGAGKKPVNRSITLSATQSTQFERFWLAYPKRKSKGDAEKAWNTLQPDEQLVDIMITAIEKAKASNDWQREGGKFIQYPATWLNKKGWQDEFQNDYLAKEAGENGRKSKYDLPADFYWTDTK